MEIEIKLSVMDSVAGGPLAFFGRLLEQAQLAGVGLGGVRKSAIRDVYYDTADGALARAGAGLRLRVQDRRHLVTLKLSRYQDGALTAREEFEEPLSQNRLTWVLSHVRALVGAGPFPVAGFQAGSLCGSLVPLLDLQTARLTRAIGREALLVLDTVVYADFNQTPFFDIEVEARSGGERLLRQVEEELHALAGGKIEPARYSKLERGLRLKDSFEN